MIQIRNRIADRFRRNAGCPCARLKRIAKLRMQGNLSEHPLAELIREIHAAGLTGALRLARERARAAIYFENGQLVFATSNLRAHRLREVVKRNGLTRAHVAEFPTNAS